MKNKMNNTKQSMKLYTEEQIRNAMRADFVIDEEIDNLINKLTPIELPSDEEIDDLAPYEADTDYDCGFHHGWIEGAKQICNRIQGGNK